MFRRQNHVAFIFIKTISHDLLVQVAYESAILTYLIACTIINYIPIFPRSALFLGVLKDTKDRRRRLRGKRGYFLICSETPVVVYRENFMREEFSKQSMISTANNDFPKGIVILSEPFYHNDGHERILLL